MTENKKIITPEFIKIIKDFYSDMINTFPEYKEHLIGVIEDIKDNNTESDRLKKVFEYCKNIYPSRFFDLLYQNEEIFTDDEINTHFIENIDFKELWNKDISENTKLIIWKYLQLICFSVINNEENSDTFKDTAHLFEAINEDELKNKLAETMEQMGDIFKNSNFNNEEDISGSQDTFNDLSNSIPNPEDLHEHLNGILGGKLGRLASEITEDTIKELGDISGVENPNDVFAMLFKNPNKLLSMIKNIGGNLDKKIKSGEIKESELIEEAGELMNKLNTMPGMKEMQKMVSSMGFPMGKNSKINMGAFKNHLNKAKATNNMRSRLKKKLETKNSETDKDDQIKLLERQLAEARAENMRNQLLAEENKNQIIPTKKRKKKGKRK
tara:strand:+ start:6290 stop:7438 length:1149 start_codon:yes stop_codon:yes gene_type:complete